MLRFYADGGVLSISLTHPFLLTLSNLGMQDNFAFLKHHDVLCSTFRTQVQSTLGFATMDKAANLDLATAKALTDLRQYINSDLVFSDLKF